MVPFLGCTAMPELSASQYRAALAEAPKTLRSAMLVAGFAPACLAALKMAVICSGLATSVKYLRPALTRSGLRHPYFELSEESQPVCFGEFSRLPILHRTRPPQDLSYKIFDTNDSGFSTADMTSPIKGVR